MHNFKQRGQNKVLPIVETVADRCLHFQSDWQQSKRPRHVDWDQISEQAAYSTLGDT